MDLYPLLNFILQTLMKLWNICPVKFAGIEIPFVALLTGCFILGLVLHFVNALSGGFLSILGYTHLFGNITMPGETKR